MSATLSDTTEAGQREKELRCQRLLGVAFWLGPATALITGLLLSLLVWAFKVSGDFGILLLPFAVLQFISLGSTAALVFSTWPDRFYLEIATVALHWLAVSRLCCWCGVGPTDLWAPIVVTSTLATLARAGRIRRERRSHIGSS